MTGEMGEKQMHAILAFSKQPGEVLPACGRLLFPFPRGTKEIGDVCAKARS